MSLHSRYADLHQVGTNAEVAGLVADHQAHPTIVFQFFECPHAHLDNPRIDSTGLGMDFEAKHAISQVQQARRVVVGHYFSCFT